MEPAMLIVMRKANMHKVHPLTDFSHSCARCRCQVGIYPTGQKAMRDHPGIEIVCDVCAGQDKSWVLRAEPLPGVEQERRDSIDVKGAVGEILSYLEPDPEPRNTPFHMRIVRIERIPGRPLAHHLVLACGHGVEAVGNLKHAAGVVLCTKCRDLAGG